VIEKISVGNPVLEGEARGQQVDTLISINDPMASDRQKKKSLEDAYCYEQYAAVAFQANDFHLGFGISACNALKPENMSPNVSKIMAKRKAQLRTSSSSGLLPKRRWLSAKNIETP